MSNPAARFFVALAVVLCAIAAQCNPAWARKSSQIVLDAGNGPMEFLNPGSQKIGENAVPGFSYRYSNVITIGSQVVDAVVTLVEIRNIDEVNAIDRLNPDYNNRDIRYRHYAPGEEYFLEEIPDTDPVQYNAYPGTPNDGSVTLRVQFFLGGSDTPVTLKNFAFWVEDVDLSQYVEVVGASSVTVTQDSALQVVNLGGGRLRVFDGAHFEFGNFCEVFWVYSVGCTVENLERSWVQFNFLSASAIDIKLGSNIGGTAAFRLLFEQADWGESTTRDFTASDAGTYWSGNGTSDVEGNRVMQSEICGVANGAPVDGAYALWVLTARASPSATLYLDGEDFTMVQSGGGTYKYVQTFGDGAFALPRAAWATHQGRGTLTLSHGCSCAN